MNEEEQSVCLVRLTAERTRFSLAFPFSFFFFSIFLAVAFRVALAEKELVIASIRHACGAAALTPSSARQVVNQKRAEGVRGRFSNKRLLRGKFVASTALRPIKSVFEIANASCST